MSTSSKVKARINIIINQNGIRSNNKLENRAIVNLTNEVPSVGAALGTVTEQRITKDQFNNFHDNVNQYVLHN